LEAQVTPLRLRLFAARWIIVINIDPAPSPLAQASNRTVHIYTQPTTIMIRGSPSKNIVPVPDLGPDVNEYYYWAAGNTVSVSRDKFIKICENASVLPNEPYTAWVTSKGILPECNITLYTACYY